MQIIDLEINRDPLPSLTLNQSQEWSHTRMPQSCDISSADEIPHPIPCHPLKVKPAGNAYVGVQNIKSAAGFFSILPDELVLKILENLGSTSLLQLGSTCKALYAFSRCEELWKTLFVEYASPSGRDLISTVFLFLVEPGPRPWWMSLYPWVFGSWNSHGLSRDQIIRSRGRDLTDTQNLNGNSLVLAAMMIYEIHDLKIILVPS